MENVIRDFKTSVITCFEKYFTFSGRASRSEYWYFYLLMTVTAFVLFFVSEWLYFLFYLGTFFPFLAAAIRRLHDIDKSGWWYLIMIIPFVGFFVVLYWHCQKGTHGVNRFGPNPLDEDERGNPPLEELPKSKDVDPIS